MKTIKLTVAPGDKITGWSFGDRQFYGYEKKAIVLYATESTMTLLPVSSWPGTIRLNWIKFLVKIKWY